MTTNKTNGRSMITSRSIKNVVLEHEEDLRKALYLGGARMHRQRASSERVAREADKFVVNRLKRTYDRLRSKGVCFDDIVALAKEMMIRGMLLAYTIELRPDELGRSTRIKTEEWYDAIDMVVLKHAPDELDNQRCVNFSPIISQHVEELWAYVVCAYNARIRSQDEPKVVIPDTDRKREERLERENAELSNQIKILQGRLEKSAEKSSRAEAELSKIRDAHQKRVLELEADHRREVNQLSKKIESLEIMTAILEKAAFFDSGDDSDVGESVDIAITDSALKAEDSTEALDIQLPETGVLFLGGHTNLVKKIRQKYPNWDYIGDKNISSAMSDRSVDVCFLWSKHLSHRATWTVNRNVKGAFPIVYLESTNLERLETEMKMGYAAAKGLIKDGQKHHIQPVRPEKNGGT